MHISSKLAFDGVSYHTDTGKVIFQDASFSIAPNRFVLVIGPSGCGKSTLLKLLTGQWLPQQGDVSVLGESINRLSPNKQRQLRRSMGMLFQHGALFTDLSVFENVAFPAREHMQCSEDELDVMVSHQLEEVGLLEAKHWMAHQLSGGMTRRVALARSMILKPDILLYDEPLTGQDPVTIRSLVTLMHAVHEKNSMTTVVVSHQIEPLLPYVTDIFMVNEQTIQYCGTPADVHQNANSKVQAFFQGMHHA